jgi:hypothetical protein
MLYSFPNIKFSLIVRIGGGILTPKYNIYLRDVMVSASSHRKGGIF